MNSISAATNNAIARNISLSEYFSQYENWLEVTKASAKTYKTGLKSFFMWLAENRILNPPRLDVIAYKKELEASGKSDSTIATYLAGVKSFFKWTEESGYYANIASRVKMPKISRIHKKDALTAAQVKNTIQNVMGKGIALLRDRAIITLISACGLRTIEVSRAKVDDIRVKNGKPVLFLQGKGSKAKDNFIPLPMVAKRAIDTYLSARGKTFKNAPLFVSISTNGTAG